MITVHHLETSRSQRVLWLLEEMGLPYELKIYKRHPVTKLAPPELKKIHPLGKSPVITMAIWWWLSRPRSWNTWWSDMARRLRATPRS